MIGDLESYPGEIEIKKKLSDLTKVKCIDCGGKIRRDSTYGMLSCERCGKHRYAQQIVFIDAKTQLNEKDGKNAKR